jgi:hypothetical protein
VCISQFFLLFIYGLCDVIEIVEVMHGRKEEIGRA